MPSFGVPFAMGFGKSMIHRTGGGPEMPSENLPTAGFDSTLIGNQTVEFTNLSFSLSEGSPTYLWDFGDGQTSSEEHPAHSYATSGNKDVSLTITDEYGSDTQNDTIVVPATGLEFSPSSTGLLFHFYAGNGVDKPAGLTVPENGAPISAWADRTGQYIAEQSSIPARPTWFRQIDLGGGLFRGGVEFDGGDLLDEVLSGDILRSLNVYTVYLVVRTTTLERGVFFSENNKASTPFVVGEINRNNGSGAVQISHRGGADGTPVSGNNGPANNAGVHLITFRRLAAASWNTRFDGMAGNFPTTLTSPGATLSGFLTIGAQYTSATPANPLNGTILDFAAYNVDNYATVEAEFAGHYGIALP